jgi:hypothetical protein
MTDLISLMSRLVDSAGNILVPGVDDMVQAAGMEERCVLSFSLFDWLLFCFGFFFLAAAICIFLHTPRARCRFGGGPVWGRVFSWSL